MAGVETNSKLAVPSCRSRSVNNWRCVKLFCESAERYRCWRNSWKARRKQACRKSRSRSRWPGIDGISCTPRFAGYFLRFCGRSFAGRLTQVEQGFSAVLMAACSVLFCDWPPETGS